VANNDAQRLGNEVLVTVELRFRWSLDEPVDARRHQLGHEMTTWIRGFF
jgi:hypothetical protein